MYVILVYDINVEDAEGKRVLRQTFKTCKQYLHHIQNSVFEGELTTGQLITMKHELKRSLRHDLDSVILFKSNNEKWLKKEFVTSHEDQTSNLI